jgi:hypothetical protein
MKKSARAATSQSSPLPRGPARSRHAAKPAPDAVGGARPSRGDVLDLAHRTSFHCSIRRSHARTVASVSPSGAREGGALSEPPNYPTMVTTPSTLRGFLEACTNNSGNILLKNVSALQLRVQPTNVQPTQLQLGWACRCGPPMTSGILSMPSWRLTDAAIRAQGIPASRVQLDWRLSQSCAVVFSVVITPRSWGWASGLQQTS